VRSVVWAFLDLRLAAGGVGCGVGYGLWAVDWGLRALGYGLWAVCYGLSAVGCGLRAMGCELWVVGCGITVLGCNIQVLMSHPKLTSAVLTYLRDFPVPRVYCPKTLPLHTSHNDVIPGGIARSVQRLATGLTTEEP
jgi:hypothetical protein